MPKIDFVIDDDLRSKFSLAMAEVTWSPLRKGNTDVWEDDNASNSYKLTLHFNAGAKYPKAIEVKKNRGNLQLSPKRTYSVAEPLEDSQNTISMSEDARTASASLQETGGPADTGHSTVFVPDFRTIPQKPFDLPSETGYQPSRNSSLYSQTPDAVPGEEGSQPEVVIKRRGHHRNVSDAHVHPKEGTQRSSVLVELEEISDDATGMGPDTTTPTVSSAGMSNATSGGINRSFTFSRAGDA